MEKAKFSLLAALLFLLSSGLAFPNPVARAEDSLLKIQVLPDQNSVKGGMMFLVHVQVANSSSDTSVEFWSNSCSYEKHWVTDHAGVFIQSWTCNENTLEQDTLGPGEVYEKNIILYIPKSDNTGPVTFRLGFKRMSEDGEVAEPLWSDPVTMKVIVPEALREVAAPGAEEVVAQAPDQASEAAVEENETPPAVASEPEVPAGNRLRVFQDPAVPITIRPGEEFSIELGSNPSTGFRWKMTLPEGQTTVKLLGAAHVASQERMPGVPGQEVYKFAATTPGETKIDFVYERPWDPKEAPTRKIFTVLVQES